MGLSNTLHYSVPGRGISGLLRSGVHPSSLIRIFSLVVLTFSFAFVFQPPCKRTKFSDFSPDNIVPRTDRIEWVDWKGNRPSVAAPLPSPAMVARQQAKVSARDLLFRDPHTFVAGEIHNHLHYWEEILEAQPKRQEILSYIEFGVDVQDFFVPFKGDFQGVLYDSPLPPSIVFPNNKTCEGFETFICDTILERLANGSLSIWGRVGDRSPPHLVMPLTVEPSKPRLCHDERFLNLWMRDLPLKLDYISDLPRYVGRNHFQSTMDDKSGYDHVRLNVNSTCYFGLEWMGWYFVFNTIPFGWKESAYIYHTIGLAATNHIRSLGVPCSQYIDDRHVGQLAPPFQQNLASETWSYLELAEAATFICAATLISLGYFIGLPKSCLMPQRSLTFLGFVVDSTRGAFLIPEAKKRKFAELREFILANRAVSVRTLQRFAGKVTSFSIAVPAAQLYAREIYRAISGFTKSSRLVKISGALRQELTYWRFLDAWSDVLPWPQEKHLTVRVFSDASNFAWGGIIEAPDQPRFSVRDYWSDNLRSLPIAVKEARALVSTLEAGKSIISNCRLDVHTDNLAFMHSWHKQGGKNRQLNEVLKELSAILLEANTYAAFHFIPSAENPADMPSRILSDKDCMLSRRAWAQVDSHFGPHTLDMMSLDSNVQRDSSGNPLKHYTPHPTPLSSGVNVFAQAIPKEANPYVFPPFVLVAPLLKFLEAYSPAFTIVVPKLYPLPFWWPVLCSRACSHLQLGRKGEENVLLFPSPRRVFNSRPLQWDLFAFRIYTQRSV